LPRVLRIAEVHLDDANGNRFEIIYRKGLGFRWKILGADNNEILRIVDPASRKEATVRDIFGGLPDGFAVIQNDTFVARVAQEDLVEGAKTKPRNRLGKFLDKVFSSRGITLRAEDGQLRSLDSRVLVAAMTLLRVHDINGAASSGQISGQASLAKVLLNGRFTD